MTSGLPLVTTAAFHAASPDPSLQHVCRRLEHDVLQVTSLRHRDEFVVVDALVSFRDARQSALHGERRRRRGSFPSAAARRANDVDGPFVEGDCPSPRSSTTWHPAPRPCALMSASTTG